MNSEQDSRSNNLSKSNDTTCSSNSSSRLACDSPSGHFAGVLRAKAGTQQPAKEHSSAPLSTTSSPCSSGNNTTSSRWSSSTCCNRSTIEFRVTKTNTGTAHKSTTSSHHHSSRPRARFSDVRCCPQRPPGDGGGGPSFLPQRPTSSQHLAACEGRHFRPDLDQPTQRSALTAHSAENRKSFVEKAQRQASMAVRPLIELPLPNALSQNYGGAPNDGESGVTSRDLAWALRSQIVEAYRYQQKRRMEEEQRGGDNGTYSPCDASAAPSPCLPFSHPPPPPPPFIATADFCRTVLEDIDTIFRICEQKDGEAAGSQRAYFHTKEQLNQLQMWRI